MRNSAKTWCTVLSLSAWILMSMSVSVECPNRCDCKGSKREKQHDCTEMTVYLYRAKKIVVINCHGQSLNESMIECFHFRGNISALQLEQCAVDSVESIVASMNATNLDDLCLIDNQMPMTEKTVQGLDNLTMLMIINSGGVQKVVPVESLKTLPHMTTLRLYNMGLSDIPANTFHNTGRQYENFKSLTIEMNNISHLGSDAFNGLHNLYKLTMYGNNIQHVDVNAFRGLVSLKDLDMTNESIAALHSSMFEYTTQLESLAIVRNRVPLRLEKGIFSSLISLQWLDLSGTKKLILGSTALSNLKSLNQVDLSESNITELPEDVFLNSNGMTGLYLHNNGLSELPNKLFSGLHLLEMLDVSNNMLVNMNEEIFESLVSLSEIKLDGNRIQVLPDYLFLSSNNLQTVSISRNMIQNISENTFNGEPLTHLNISHNTLSWCSWVTLPRNLSQLDQSVLKKLPNLEVLDLSNNEIEGVCSDWLLMDNLKELDLSSNRLKSLSEEEMQFQYPEVSVNFQNNFITSVSPPSSDSRTGVFHLGINPFTCDCHLYELLISNKRTYNLIGAQCSQPESLKNVSLLDFTNEERLDSLTCSVNGSKSCGECLFRRNKNITECSCQNMLSIPKPFVKGGTIKLKLLGTVDIPDLSTLPTFVTALNLSSLNWETIPEIPTSVRELDLRNNRLQQIPIKVFSGNLKLYLGNNSIQCDCSGRESVRNLQNNRQNIMDYEDILCIGDLYVKEITVESLCSVHNATTISVSLISIVIIVLSSMFFVCKYIPEVQVLLYAYGLEFLVPKDRISSRYYKYDVYLSYATNSEASEGDETFVTETLVPELRRMEYEVHGYFDFEIGARILDQIYEAVALSKITLFVISNAFINNVWSLEELRSSLLQGIIEKSDRIMFILLEELDLSRNESRLKLKALLKGHTCIKRDCSDELFIKRLKKRLHKRLTPGEITRRQKALRTLQAFGIGSHVLLTENGEMYKEIDSNTSATHELQALVPKNA